MRSKRWSVRNAVRHSAPCGWIEHLLFPLRPAVNECDVGLVNFTILHCHAEEAGEFVILRDEHDAAGLAVEAVDDGNLAAVSDLIRQEIAETMPESGRAIRITGVDLQRSRFVDDDVAVGLVDDGEGGVVTDAHSTGMASSRP